MNPNKDQSFLVTVWEDGKVKLTFSKKAENGGKAKEEIYKTFSGEYNFTKQSMTVKRIGF